jgi:hypothetical protein
VSPLPERQYSRAPSRHHEDVRDLHRGELFGAHPARGEHLVAEGAGLYLDRSQNRITAETSRLRVALAHECRLHDRVGAMFRGEKINVSENQAVRTSRSGCRGAIGSWLLDLTAQALCRSPSLEELSGRVSDSGEGCWTTHAAVEEGGPAPVLTASLYSRFGSRGLEDFANRVLSATRRQFGGHAEEALG